MSEVNDSKNEKLVIGDDVFVPFLTEQQIQNRIKELAEQISQEYKEKIPIFIGIFFFKLFNPVLYHQKFFFILNR